MQKEFINIAAHELRNPIQPILGLSEALRSTKKGGTTDEDKFLLDTIIRNARRLKRIAENLLDVSRIESRSLKLDTEIFNINDLISTTIADYMSHIEKGRNSTTASHLKLRNQPSTEDLFVEGDKYRLVQVISNLLNNAISFTKGDGIIDVKTSEKIEGDHNQQFVEVSVKDSGTGIATEMLPRLFSKNASNTDFGSGLGLFISRSIVEAHGGKISAQNNADENGATFTFTLPLHS